MPVRPSVVLSTMQVTAYLTVLAGKHDAAGKELFAALQHLPPWYKRIDWWDKAEGPLPNPDVSYPALKRAAAFVCTQSRCSLPIFTSAGVAEFLNPSAPKAATAD